MLFLEADKTARLPKLGGRATPLQLSKVDWRAYKRPVGRKNNVDVASEERAPKDRKLTLPDALTIVLLEPRIPQNTGSIARMCAATGSRLDLVAPLFKLDDAKLKRAGLDYWPLLDVRVFESRDAWLKAHPGVKPWLVEVGGTITHAEAAFAPSDCIVFGDEQEGVAPEWLARWPERHLRIPQQGVRSLNQAMAVGIVAYEALRQLNWNGLEGQ